MRRRSAGIALVALLASAANAAQPGDAIAPGFKAPRIGSDYLNKLGALPDWNGMWELAGTLLFDPKNTHMAPDPAGAVGGTDFGPRAGSYVSGMPYKPEYQKQYDATVHKAHDQGEATDPVGNCMQPHGMPREMSGAPGPIEIIMLPGQVHWTWNWFNATRRIYTDGRPHPSGDDLYATFMGHSIGHWDGDTLVVDTVGMVPGVYDQSGAPHSGDVHLAERIRMVAPDMIEDQMTITDPVMFTKPWQVTRDFHKMKEDPAAIMGSYCDGGNDRLDYVDGAQHIVLPSEKSGSAK